MYIKKHVYGKIFFAQKKVNRNAQTFNLVTSHVSRYVFGVKSTIYFIGSVYGYSQVENYDSLLAVLRDLSDEDKQQLVQKIQVMIAPMYKVEFGKVVYVPSHFYC